MMSRLKVSSAVRRSVYTIENRPNDLLYRVRDDRFAHPKYVADGVTYEEAKRIHRLGVLGGLCPTTAKREDGA